MFGVNFKATPEYAKSQTAVWWDMDSCPVPDGYDPRRVRPSIEGVLKSLGYSGPVTITAIGNLGNTPDSVLQGIASTGIALEHTVSEMVGGKIFLKVLLFKSHNTPPATIMLISDRVDNMAPYLCLAQQNVCGFNLLLAYTKSTQRMRTLLTSAEWLWETILAGGSEANKQETRRFVLRKCSESGESGESGGSGERASFLCSSCNYTALSVTDLSRHLSTKKHKQQDINDIKSRMPDPGEGYTDDDEEQSKAKAPKSKKKKRSRKALRTNHAKRRRES